MPFCREELIQHIAVAAFSSSLQSTLSEGPFSAAGKLARITQARICRFSRTPKSTFGPCPKKVRSAMCNQKNLLLRK
jgi:hypothetical protein